MAELDVNSQRAWKTGLQILRQPLWSLIAVQTMCVVLGVWIHFRLVIATAQWSKSELAATEAVTSEAVLQALPGTGAVIGFWICVLQSAAAYLVLSRMHGQQTQKQQDHDRQSLQRTQELVRTRDAIIFGLAKLADSRDPETGHHLQRIALYSNRLATALRRHPKYRTRITPTMLRALGVSSALHDIGKVGVADSILLKPGPLTEEERAEMESHTLIGALCIRDIETQLGNSNFLTMAREIALNHHERWNGSGYPYGIAGEDIPLAARIVAIADVYDALSVRRVYKQPLPHETCVDIIRQGAGTQFDPELVNVFLQIEQQFREIARQYPETEAVETEQTPENTTVTPSTDRLTVEQERIIRQQLDTPDRIRSELVTP